MVTPFKVAVIAIAAVSSLALAGLHSSNTYAAPANGDKYIYSIDPRCSDESAGISMFEINNQEPTDLYIDYVNNDNGDAGTYMVPAGTSQIFTAYTKGANNQITFTTDDGQSKTTNANTASCSGYTLPTPLCADVRDASNLRVVWTSPSEITIATKNGLPACDTVELYYSTYRMPDNYDGQGFFLSDGSVNPTAIPQTGQDVFSFTIEGGTFGTWLMNVPAPDFCYNTQADLYYGPQITNIGGDGYGYTGKGERTSQPGHGTQNIASQIFDRDDSQCAPGMGGGNGGGTTTPTTPTTPTTNEGGKGAGTTITTSTPTVLPDTGVDMSGNILSTILSLVFGAMSMMTLGIRALRG